MIDALPQLYSPYRKAEGMSYDRRVVSTEKQAGRNGLVRVNGTPKKGTILYRMKVTMPPRFTGAYLDSTIRTLAREGLLRVLRNANRETVWVTTSITDEYASDQGDGGLWLVAEANWAGKGKEFVRALEGFSDSLGYTLDSNI